MAYKKCCRIEHIAGNDEEIDCEAHGNEAPCPCGCGATMCNHLITQENCTHNWHNIIIYLDSDGEEPVSVHDCLICGKHIEVPLN